MWFALTGFLRKNRDSPPTRGTSPSKGSITTLITPWIYGNTGENKSNACGHERRKLKRVGARHSWAVERPELAHTHTIGWKLDRCQALHLPASSSTFSILFYGNCWDYRIWKGLVVLCGKQNAAENTSREQKKFKNDLNSIQLLVYKKINWHLTPQKANYILYDQWPIGFNPSAPEAKNNLY